MCRNSAAVVTWPTSPDKRVTPGEHIFSPLHGNEPLVPLTIPVTQLNTILHLERPLGVLDLETTGVNPEVDRIIKFTLTIHYPHRDSIFFSTLVNPGIPILNTIEGRHGITDDDVIGAPTFNELGPALAPRMINIDLAGYTVTFDIEFTRYEMKRADVEWPWQGYVIDAHVIWRLMKPRSLINAYEEFVDPGGFDGAHTEADVPATEAVLAGQLRRFPELPRTVRELAEFCFPPVENAVDKEGKFVWDDYHHAVFNFGKKHQGRRLALVAKNDANYLRWMLTGNFSEEVKIIVSRALAGVLPERLL